MTNILGRRTKVGLLYRDSEYGGHDDEVLPFRDAVAAAERISTQIASLEVILANHYRYAFVERLGQNFPPVAERGVLDKSRVIDFNRGYLPPQNILDAIAELHKRFNGFVDRIEVAS